MAITAAVGGCEQGDPEDPGNLQFDWLAVQLARFRSRGMQVRLRWSRRSKLSRIDTVGVLGVESLADSSSFSQVWLTGHVPPSADNFFPDCVSLEFYWRVGLPC